MKHSQTFADSVYQRANYFYEQYVPEPHPVESLQQESKLKPRSQFLNAETKMAFDWLLPHLDDPQNRDLLVQVNKSKVVAWRDVGQKLLPLPDPQITAAELYAQAVQLIAVGGRQLDQLHPVQNVRLGQGIRVHAVLPPLAIAGPALSIRLPSLQNPNYERLVAAGLCDLDLAAEISAAFKGRKNILITGSTGSGKTTLLGALLGLVSSAERIITIEDIAELRPNHPHHLALEAQQPNSEGSGRVSLNDLLIEALRMRPDRIILGECRGAELVTLFAALNTGHNGSAGTLHASSLQDVAARVAAMGQLGGLAERAIFRQFAAAIDLVLHIEKISGKHKIVAVGIPELHADGTLKMRELTADFVNMPADSLCTPPTRGSHRPLKTINAAAKNMQKAVENRCGLQTDSVAIAPAANELSTYSDLNSDISEDNTVILPRKSVHHDVSKNDVNRC